MSGYCCLEQFTRGAVLEGVLAAPGELAVGVELVCYTPLADYPVLSVKVSGYIPIAGSVVVRSVSIDIVGEQFLVSSVLFDAGKLPVRIIGISPCGLGAGYVVWVPDTVSTFPEMLPMLS